ncbi:MAG: prepilin-type N-terminal cleavage/methylation domain-containing protein [Bacillota bacterium]
MKIIKSEQGFTLVEMLLVLVVIGILTSISIPGLAGVREQADSTSVQLEMSGIKNLLELEYMDNNYLYPESQAEFELLKIENPENYIYESKNLGKDYLLKSKPDADGNYYETTGLNTAIIKRNEPIPEDPEPTGI